MTAMPSASKLIERSAGVCRQQGMSRLQAYITVAMAARNAKALLSEYGWTDLGWLDEIENLAAYRAAAVSGWTDPRAPDPAGESESNAAELLLPSPGRLPQRSAPSPSEHS